MNNILSVVKVLIFEYIVSAVLLVAVAFVVYKAQLTQSLAGFCVMAVYALSTFLGGLIMGKLKKSKRLVWGFVAGVMYFAVLIFVALIMQSGFSADNNVILAAILCVFGGCIGGMVS